MTMNLYKVNEVYFNKLFTEEWNDDIKGKVLLVDKHTMGIISMCYSQSQLLQQDVVLIELIDNYSQLDQMKHLNCIIYIKPVVESIELLLQELNHPHFHNYKLFFSNIINKSQLEKIAEFDKFEVISNILELFQDYLVVNDNLFKVIPNSIIDESNKIISLLLSIKKFPVIKYESNSISLKKLSSEILYQINSNLNNNLFENLNYGSPPILLLFDRYNDPITPLLNPWTYQSMIHELIGIDKNIATVGNEKILLNESQDDFLKQTIYSNYGDLTETFQKKVEVLKKESNANVKTSNLMELKKILTRLPDFKKKLSNVLKHLNLISELDNQISKQNLWEVSELQQMIVCSLDNKSVIDERMTILLSNNSVSTNHKIILILLYSIKFNDPVNHQNVNKFANYLQEPSLVQLKLLTTFNKMFKDVQLQQDQESENNLKKFFKNFSNSNEVDNVYLQYQPPLKDFLEKFITNNQLNYHNLNTLVPETLSESNMVQDVIIYFKNGVTYEESRIVHEFNQANNKINLIIGGDRILNSDDWLNELYNHIN